MSTDQVAISLPDAARKYGLKYPALYAAVKSGHLKSKRLGTRFLLRIDDLEAWYAALPDGDEPTED